MGQPFHARGSQKGAHGCAILDDWSSLLGGCTARELPVAVPLRWDGIWGSRAALARDVSHVAPLRRGHRGRPAPAEGVGAAAHCSGRRRRDFYLPPRLGVSNLTFLGRPLPTKDGLSSTVWLAAPRPFLSLGVKITLPSTSLFLCYSAIVRLWI